MALPLRPLGSHSGILASAQGFGAMQLLPGFLPGPSGPEEEQNAKTIIQKASELGVTLINTADFYGGGINHVQIGKAIKGIPREKLVITSKWGPCFTNGALAHDYSAKFCQEKLDHSLKTLGVDYIDVLVLRSKPKDTAIEDIVKIMAAHVKSGKVKGIGLSEIAPQDIEKAAKVHPITCIEMEWSLFARDAERDIVPVARRHGIAFLAYSPLGRGALTGTIKSAADLQGSNVSLLTRLPWFTADNLSKNNKLIEKMAAIATKKGCTPAQLALAWVHHQGDDVFPIPGTKTAKYLVENVGAFQVKLTQQELQEIEAAVPQDAVAGERSPDQAHWTYHGDMQKHNAAAQA